MATGSRAGVEVGMFQESEFKIMNLPRFVAEEHEHFTRSVTTDLAEFAGNQEVQKLYEDVLSRELAAVDEDLAVLQMLVFTHYYFLYSTTALMRWHLSEAFAGVRIAIDGALVAAQLIHDRRSHVPYTARTKPFDNFSRYLGNLMKDGKPLPHPLVPTLIALHKKLSTFTSHADVGSFVHRVAVMRDGPERQLVVQYFQRSDDAREREVHGLALCHAFVMVLDVFSEFLVKELRLVPPSWIADLRSLGSRLEQRHAVLREGLRSSEEATAGEI